MRLKKQIPKKWLMRLKLPETREDPEEIEAPGGNEHHDW